MEEGKKIYIPASQLFKDEDIVLGEIVNERLDIKIESKDDSHIEGLSLDFKTNGDIELHFEPPRGLKSYTNHEFRIIATDQMGEEAYTDWFNAYIKPTSEIVNLTIGKNQKPISEVDKYYTVDKNIEFDLANTLGLNYVEISDPEGDNIFLIISVPYQSTEIRIANSDNSEIIDKTINEDGALFKISLHNLAEATNTNLGDLSNLVFKLRK